MKNQTKTTAFTMIELLIALAIIVMIVSAVYSTYFVTAKSVQKCREKLTHTQQARSLLAKMGCQ
jgi:prepilin-type N-terminal cleavage/methylation domain-containing protein